MIITKYRLDQANHAQTSEGLGRKDTALGQYSVPHLDPVTRGYPDAFLPMMIVHNGTYGSALRPYRVFHLVSLHH